MTVNVPRKHDAGASAVLVHPQFERLTARIKFNFVGHTPRTTLIPPATEGVVADSYLTAIIVSQPELNRVMFRYVNEADHVDHEQIACAVLVRFTVITSVDVVLGLRTA